MTLKTLVVLLLGTTFVLILCCESIFTFILILVFILCGSDFSSNVKAILLHSLESSNDVLISRFTDIYIA